MAAFRPVFQTAGPAAAPGRPRRFWEVLKHSLLKFWLPSGTSQVRGREEVSPASSTDPGSLGARLAPGGCSLFLCLLECTHPNRPENPESPDISYGGLTCTNQHLLGLTPAFIHSSPKCRPSNIHQCIVDTQKVLPPHLGASLNHDKERSPDTCHHVDRS